MERTKIWLYVKMETVFSLFQDTVAPELTWQKIVIKKSCHNKNDLYHQDIRNKL